MKTLIIISALFLSGCATYNYNKIGEGHDVWVAQKIKGEDETLFYCASNKQSSGEALPICYEAKMIDRKQKAKND